MEKEKENILKTDNVNEPSKVNEKITDKKEYFKKYYETHKQKMLMQIRDAKRRQRVQKIIKKLNNSEYKRVPNEVMQKHNIKYDEEKKIYYV